VIIIHFLPYYHDDDDRGKPTCDWEILNRILPYLRRKVSLTLYRMDYDAEVEDIQGLRRFTAIP
jgi:hypothetical protein